MRKSLFVFVPALLAGFLMVSKADAQCCGSVCLNEAQSGCPDPCTIESGTVPLQSESCTETGVSGMSVTGCTETPAACAGGRGDASIAGCIGVGGQYITGAAPPHQDAQQCTTSAVNACRAVGATNTAPDEACGYCPGQDDVAC